MGGDVSRWPWTLATSDLPLSQWQEPDPPHSGEARVAILLGLEEPPGAGWSQGWKNWSSCPPPSTATILDFEEERVSAGTGGSLHSTQDGNGRGVPEERRQEKAQERKSGVGTRQEPLQPLRLDLLVWGIFNRLQKQEENGS